jgi:ABC-type spermidine/putrescine transport system permease subunit I
MFLGLVLWPALHLVRLSLYSGGGQSGFGIGGGFYKPGTWTIGAYQALLGDAYFWEILRFTLWLGLVVTALCLLLAYPTAYWIWQIPRKWKGLAIAAVIVPKLSNLLVTIYGLKLILGDYGPVNEFLMFVGATQAPIALENSTLGVVIGKTVLVVPYTILFLWVGLERIDRTLVASARGLGAGAWTAFVRVTLPLSLPSVATAALVSLIWALGAFVSPYLLGGPDQITLAVDIQRQYFENLNWPRGAAEGVAMLLTLSILVALYYAPHRWLLLRYGTKAPQA